MITGGYTTLASVVSSHTKAYYTASSTASSSLEAHGINRQLVHVLALQFPLQVRPTTSTPVSQLTILSAGLWSSLRVLLLPETRLLVRLGQLSPLAIVPVPSC